MSTYEGAASVPGTSPVTTLDFPRFPTGLGAPDGSPRKVSRPPPDSQQQNQEGNHKGLPQRLWMAFS